MKWLLVLCALATLTSCNKNGRDALETHQIIAEPKTRWIHWQQEEPVDVTEERVKSIRPCQKIP
jgi:hypothetical protein